MTPVDPGAVLFYAGVLLMSLGVAGWLMRRWEAELKRVLPRYRKRNRVQGESGG